MTIEEITSLGKGIACDSRQVQAGDIFVSIPCPRANDYIQQAIDRGASAVVIGENETYIPPLNNFSSSRGASSDVVIQENIGMATPLTQFWAGARHDEEPCKTIQKKYNSKATKILPTLNPRLMLAKLAKAFYSHQPKNTVAVTGTNGKSSVVHLTRQLWEGCDYSSASLGTLGLISKQTNDLQLPSLTTLDPISLHKTLNTLSQKPVEYFAFEASSHGLDQYRLHAVELKAAGFTNLTQDHLDYHQTMEDYFLAKAKLFTEVLPEGATAVLNKDSAFFDQLHTFCHQRSQTVLTYSLTQKADLTARAISQHSGFLEFDLDIMGQIYPGQKVNLAGRFQLENLLCALGLTLVTGAPVNNLIKTLPSLQAVKGRMQWVGTHNQGSVFVDYAHTPDALKTVLKNLLPHAKGQLWVVFGCGGNRDALKRPQMGAIACEYADHVIVTDDNPRHEEPAAIRQQILAACPNAVEIADRRQAIRSTIAQLKEGDIVLIAGKGHETDQIVGDTTYPFDDQIEVETFLKECMNV